MEEATNSAKAHTPNSENKWHELTDHLITVSRETQRFARAFGMPRLGSAVGLLHDIGKAEPAFQQYLRDQHAGIVSPKVPHAAWGAAIATALLGRAHPDGQWVEPALAVLGHHAGLSARGALGPGFEKKLEHLRSAQDDAKAVVGFLAGLPPISICRGELDAGADHRAKECRELLLRMLFSALIDADRLDTERHFNREKHSIRRNWWPLQSLWPALRRNQIAKMADGRGPSRVNRVRREVYRACRRCAKQAPGIFRLTVPTGGGKTRSSLAFALMHARHNLSHGFRRVIFALPFTSIVDQTVREYRAIFPGAGRVVLEHHSQVRAEDDDGKQSEEERRRQLAEENWDAPLIVTTTVQLFESLLSAKPSRCRKIHNIARSIVVLDEVQALPPHVLETTMSALRTLAERCGVSVVLCTATQPVFEETPYLRAFSGLRVTAIVSDADAARHFNALKRVKYERRDEALTWVALAAELAKDEGRQSMVVLNTRRDALRLLNILVDRGVEGLLHLSTLLCGAHRRCVLSEIHKRLKRGQTVRLISTQVVEAGVDLDFPLVYRAMAPLDRLIQAAGRCNREGRREFGRVIVFEPAEGAVPRGPYKVGLEEARKLLCRHDPEKLHDPALCREYFATMFGNLNLDAHSVQALRREMNYPEVGRLYRLIEEDTVPVVVPEYAHGEGRKRLTTHLAAPSRTTFRRLQPYVVNLYQHEASRLEAGGWVSQASESLFVWEGKYESQAPHRGMEGAMIDPSDLTTLTLEEAGWSI